MFKNKGVRTDYSGLPSCMPEGAIIATQVHFTIFDYNYGWNLTIAQLEGT